MSGDKVADIVAGQNDFTGTKIETVFSKVGERFAVYATSERVMVQYADDEKLGQDQRLALVGLSPLRGEINGLIDGWRAAKYGNGRSRADGTTDEPPMRWPWRYRAISPRRRSC